MRFYNGFLFQVARKDSVAQLMWRAAAWAIHAVKRRSAPPPSQWSRSFAPADVKRHADHDLCDGLAPLHPEETFFEAIGTGQGNGQSEGIKLKLSMNFCDLTM